MASPYGSPQQQPPPPPPPPPGPWNTAPEVEVVKGLVGKYFPIYEVRVSYDTISLSCSMDNATLEGLFDSLRREMKGYGYIPILTYERGEHVIHVVRTQRSRPFGVWVNLLFFIATIVTTLIAGAFLYAGYKGWEDVFSFRSLAWGAITFTIPLMVLLGLHELSHFFAARRHGIAASLPFFIPSVPPLGTFGALISLREPIPSKKAMLDVGSAGPLASFIISLPLVIIGLQLSSVDPGVSLVNAGGREFLGSSLMFDILSTLIPMTGALSPIHPTAFAGWVGLFVTAINLLPVGQLDGGHIARAIFGEKAKWFGYGTLALLLILGFFYLSWLILALFILFMGGIRHPPPLNDVTKLDVKRQVVGGIMALVLITCFVPMPMGTIAENYGFAVVPDDNGAPGLNLTFADANLTARSHPSLPTNISIEIWVVNTGNMRENVTLERELPEDLIRAGWDAYFMYDGNASDGIEVHQDSGESAAVQVVVVMPPGATGNATFDIMGKSWRDKDISGGGIAQEMRVTVSLDVLP